MIKTNIKEYPGVYRDSETSFSFKVWAPLAKKIDLLIKEKKIAMKQEGEYHCLEKVSCAEGDEYSFLINGQKSFPDPLSFSQSGGVFAKSEILDIFRFKNKSWNPPSLEDLIFYELHTGTFSPEGNFQGIVYKLDHLADLGITAIVIMPLNSFPGCRNWGYDGVFLNAVQHSYGEPDKLKILVEECHKRGIALIVDVVYNHLGPEGNVLAEFAPYFTDKYHNHWGEALNFDDSFSAGVREFFYTNILLWLDCFGCDGLRLDAIHGIKDESPEPFLQELAMLVKELERKNARKYFIIAESDLNDVKIIKPLDKNGYGHDAQWQDDFHHSLHTALTTEKKGYYKDYRGVHSLSYVINNKVLFDGRYSEYRQKKHGNSFIHADYKQLVVYAQTHDQVGNRADGKRLASLVSHDALALAAAAYILSPFTPQIFMGEEYGEKNPFYYFIDHQDKNLSDAVNKGRKKELRNFGWNDTPPDCFLRKCFENSKLSWKMQAKNKELFSVYKQLIAIRKDYSLSSGKYQVKAEISESLLIIIHTCSLYSLKIYLNFSANPGLITSSCGERVYNYPPTAEKEGISPYGIIVKKIVK